MIAMAHLLRIVSLAVLDTSLMRTRNCVRNAMSIALSVLVLRILSAVLVGSVLFTLIHRFALRIALNFLEPISRMSPANPAMRSANDAQDLSSLIVCSAKTGLP